MYVSNETPRTDPIDAALVEAATGPKSYEVDGEKVTMRSVSEIAEAASALARRKAARNPFGALKFAGTTTEGPAR